ncbi:MAG: hypothetical protein ACFFDB_02795 [Promethearchaeota archaeon]
MRKKKTIQIKDPRLRKIRNELRSLLFAARSVKMNEILDAELELQQTEGFWDKSHPNFKVLHKKARELSVQGEKLTHIYKASILFCPVCMKSDKDMTYNPVLEEWLCTECYEENRKFHIEEGRPDLFP